jgi:hypothetical protein
MRRGARQLSIGNVSSAGIGRRISSTRQDGADAKAPPIPGFRPEAVDVSGQSRSRAESVGFLFFSGCYAGVSVRLTLFSFFPRQSALDRAEWHNRATIHALAAPRLFSPVAFPLNKFRPPRISAALAWPYRIDAAAVVRPEKRTAAVASQPDASRVRIDTHQVAASEPANREFEECADRLTFRGAGFNVMIRVASAAGTTAGAFKVQRCCFVKHSPLP